MARLFKKLQPSRVIALGFAAVILLGSLLLILPFSVKEGVELKYIDALYTSTSAVCVTGLIAVDAGATFTLAGQIILGCLIQIGGLGVTSVGAGVIVAMRKKMGLMGHTLVREGSNLSSGKGVVKFVKSVFYMTLIIELAGAALSFAVFIRDFDFTTSLGLSLFHSVAAFNNSGFDILGTLGTQYVGQNLIPYQSDILLNLVTCALIILGGIGFLVIKDVLSNKFRWKKFSMHTKVVLSASGVLLVLGTLLIKLTENITWLGAFFSSVTARTAGFSTFPLSEFTNAGLLVMMVLMFIGASPGSTGGGIKTSTFFVLLQGIKSAATNKSEKAFKYSLPADAFKKAAVITLLAISLVLLSTFLIVAFEPEIRFVDALFEMTSAFGTVGLSTGITGNLTVASKIVSILMMYIGRLGPLTVATLWYFTKGERVSYPTGNIAIG